MRASAPAVGAVLVVAKAPVPGQAKTRLATAVGDQVAADIAACALLDLVAAARACAAHLLVALTGDLAAAARGSEIAAALRGADVFAQRGDSFGDRLAGAHADAHRLLGERAAPVPVLQVGMDTPQLSAAMLAESLRTAAVHDAVLGPAEDGGWWGLAVRDPAVAARLRDVEMSRDDTGRATQQALESAGVAVALLPPLRDVDTWADARAVARLAPHGRFAAAVTAATRVAP